MKINKTFINIFLGIIGFVIIAYLVNQLGFSTLLNTINNVGWNLLIILLFPIYWFFMHAVATYFTLSDENKKNIGIFRLTVLQTISYGVAWSQPLQGIVGEPIKMLFLDKNKFDKEDYAASLLIDNTLNFLANFIVIFIAMFLIVYVNKTSLILKLSIYALILFVFIFFYFLFRIQKKGLFSKILSLLAKFKPFTNFANRNTEKFSEIDKNINVFYKHEKRGFYLSLLFHILERIHGVLEFYLIFYFLGKPVSIITSLFIYGIVNGLDNLLFFIQIGGMEVYTSLLLKALRLSKDNINITVSLFRRIRILFWVIMSFILIYPAKLLFKKKGKDPLKNNA